MAWRNATLGEVAPLSYGKALPEAKRAGGDVPVFGSNGIVGWHDSAIVNNPSVVIGRKGSVGALQFSEVPSWPIDTAFFTEGSSECDIRFLRYLFTTLPLQESSDSAVPGLNRDYAHSLKVRIPELAEQKAIANALGILDEKIRVNQQIASTLEQIAQTVFKSWFVDFDPVHAKARGEQPVGMDAETAALFPDTFEDSELGPIPSGWAFGTVSEIVDRQRPGKLFDKKTSSDEGQIPVLDQGASGLIGYHNEEPGVNASPDNPYVVFANHTCSLRIVSYPFSVIQNVFPIHGNNVSTIWLYFALQGKQEFDSYKGHWPDLVIKPVVIPDEKVTDAFALLVEPLMKEAWILEHQNQTLSNLRDSLLPRLISGELEIPAELLEA